MNNKQPIEPSIMAEYEALTDENNHTRALVVLAKACGLSELVPTLNEIYRQHIQAGGLSRNLSDLRHVIHRQVIDKCNQVFADFPYQ